MAVSKKSVKKDKEPDFKIETDPSLKEKFDKEVEVYDQLMNLDDGQRARLVEEILEEDLAIQEEIDGKKLRTLWRKWDSQYEGELEESKILPFNIHQHMTKTKIDRLTNRTVDAFRNNGNIYSVTPRPENEARDAEDTAQKIEDFLDYELDTQIHLMDEMPLVFRNSYIKNMALLKIPYVIERDVDIREECFNGEKDGFERLLSSYTEEIQANPEKFRKHFENLDAGKTIYLMTSKKYESYNAPKPEFIEVENFRVRMSTRPNYQALLKTKLIIEIKEYFYWELEKLVKHKKLRPVIEKLAEKDRNGRNVKGYRNKKHKIYECTYDFDVNEDGEETRIVTWISPVEKLELGSFEYPYYRLKCIYIPFCPLPTKEFYSNSMTYYLADSNIASNAIINLLLTSVYARNMITPLIEDDESNIANQFLENDFDWGRPIFGNVDFLQKYMPNIDVRGLSVCNEILARNADDISSVTASVTGKESQLDPEAPARKTLALLEQAGLDIAAFVKIMLCSFNAVATVILQLFYQFSREGVKFKSNTKRKYFKVHGNPFERISREDFIAQVDIQAQAATFNFDKANEKAENLALHQYLRYTSPMVRNNPDAAYEWDKTLIESWSPLWRNRSDRVLPNPEQFEMMKLQASVQALTAILQSKIEESQATGVELQADAEFIAQIIEQVNIAQRRLVTDPSKEELKAEEQQER